ncbi:MAG: AAA family ATPase [Deltaproteobacteria bacterium]|nr:AAA family ATPase [Deltaproteobacteria bacterium]
MDKGAHFYKCDFQVHTPRDINWKGKNAVTDEERKAYSEDLILASRAKGLDAIAITDHHDFAFFPYIKKAAESELDDSGNPISENNRIIVFPGLELTLASPPCQALFILDADFPENLFQGILAALGITPNESTEQSHAQIRAIPGTIAQNLTELYDKLDSLDYLKGRYIIFPHVQDGGHKTILRSGFAEYYKSMPCVGGYVDGSVSKLGNGNLAIINGKDRNYGFKSIAVIQTSDNRNQSHEDLGKHVTWIKWSEATAEALRQACLAKESRMSQDEPLLPNIWITSVSVSNSKFLGRVNLDLNQQYNAIIGGRGTGKSTILEYLRWGLCDQPVENNDPDLTAVQKSSMTKVQSSQSQERDYLRLVRDLNLNFF